VSTPTRTRRHHRHGDLVRHESLLRNPYSTQAGWSGLNPGVDERVEIGGSGTLIARPPATSQLRMTRRTSLEPDVVITDIRLPQSAGFTAVAWTDLVFHARLSPGWIHVIRGIVPRRPRCRVRSRPRCQPAGFVGVEKRDQPSDQPLVRRRSTRGTSILAIVGSYTSWSSSRGNEA
jgi:hypothetical protein